MPQIIQISGHAHTCRDYRGVYVHFKWPFADFHADSSFQANPPSFSLLRVDELPPTGGDTAWYA